VGYRRYRLRWAIAVLFVIAGVSAVNGESGASFTELPEISLPAAQADDDQSTEVTVGEMRNALAYYEAYKATRTFYNDEIVPRGNKLIEALQVEQKRHAVSIPTAISIGLGALGLGALLGVMAAK